MPAILFIEIQNKQGPLGHIPGFASALRMKKCRCGCGSKTTGLALMRKGRREVSELGGAHLHEGKLRTLTWEGQVPQRRNTIPCH